MVGVNGKKKGLVVSFVWLDVVYREPLVKVRERLQFRLYIKKYQTFIKSFEFPKHNLKKS